MQGAKIRIIRANLHERRRILTERKREKQGSLKLGIFIRQRSSYWNIFNDDLLLFGSICKLMKLVVRKYTPCLSVETLIPCHLY